MKNLQIVIAQALHFYELEHIEQSISYEINNTILEIVVNDESFEKLIVTCIQKDPKKSLKALYIM